MLYQVVKIIIPSKKSSRILFVFEILLMNMLFD